MVLYFNFEITNNSGILYFNTKRHYLPTMFNINEALKSMEYELKVLVILN